MKVMLSRARNKLWLATLLLVAGFFVVSAPVVRAQTWTAQTSGLTIQTLYDVFFVNSSTGWAVGDAGKILTTTNGGSTWTAQTSGITGATNFLYSVFFINSTTGWTVGYDGNGGAILATTNGGSTWTAQTSGTTRALKSIFFTDASTGWAVGEFGVILATTNGGANWTAQTSGTSQNLFDVYFVNSSTGWAVGVGGIVLKTTNGGSNWASSNSGIVTSDVLYDAFFLNTSTGWAVGDDDDTPLGVIYKTANGGTSWTVQTPGSISALRGVFFTDASTGWVVGDAGTILTTTNGGSTWTAQTSGTNQLLHDAFFVDSSTGWAVGSGGRILKFTGASSSNSRRPLTFEEQSQRIASRLAPNAPRDARVVPLPCRNDNCPAEIEFVYEPLELHRGRAVSFVFYDDAGRKAASLSAMPALASREYRLTLRPNGGNSAVSGEICAVVGAQESCTPVQGWANIALDQNAIAWNDELLDVARGEYRLSFWTAKLPANYDVGKTKATIAVYEDDDTARVIVERAVTFAPYVQVFVPVIRAGSYIIRITPYNAAGKAGATVEQRHTVPLLSVAEKATAPSEGVNEAIREALSRLGELLRALLQLLRE